MPSATEAARGYTTSPLSRAVTVTVQQAVTAALTSSATSYAYGGRPVLTVRLAPTTAPGTVTFYDGSTSLGRATLSAGTAKLTAPVLGVGTHRLTARYAGGGLFAASTSAVRTLTVGKRAAAVSLKASSTSVRTTTTVALTATVAPSSATGTVTFRDGTRSLGTAKVSSGRAVLKVRLPRRGTRSVTAAYGGSSTVKPATSKVLSVRVR
ncbi:hypothetical protein GCM10025868_39860 [Angustibacter aerolatus]|uniref:Bacterial Ig-like domain-containing protein n=1 Tax=Angustibacter aerolatus TaxID=1162965 RepID=A0ABQ6JKE5_9ACTN|nr:hypothetical protein GCM10025868_39860 [Angustibacter aerolatus]